jgi:hypothetical protein
MSNPLHPDDVKIGQSSKDPNERRKELATTGVLEEFLLEYWALAEDYESLEREIHRALANVRTNPKKEFFNISVPEAVNKIREISGNRIESDKVFYVSPEEFQRIKDEKQRKSQEKLSAFLKIQAEIENKKKLAEEKETKRKLKERERKFAASKKWSEEEQEKKRQNNRFHRKLIRVVFFPYFVFTEMNEGSAWKDFIGFLLCFPYLFFLGAAIGAVISLLGI